MCPFSTRRPPGHHSQRAAASGFCVFNNVALAAKHAQQRHGLHRCVLGHYGAGAQARWEVVQWAAERPHSVLSLLGWAPQVGGPAPQ